MNETPFTCMQAAGAACRQRRHSMPRPASLRLRLSPLPRLAPELQRLKNVLQNLQVSPGMKVGRLIGSCISKRQARGAQQQAATRHGTGSKQAG